ncbi:hypothetical protein N7450_009344 [Penicillium hetheringtonii]|uniref:PHD-type domain-containing protein n=1 Tax=Penicillium hetheringtonii TaxID=911720 RepID=A0AAD6GNE8_9EURO|nr:hypothetical protein N7450_009344 [Penicillium hetheringtonii]
MSTVPHDNAAMPEESSGRPAKRLKITFKQEKPDDEFAIKREGSIDEVLPSPNARMSRSGRAIRAPTAYVPSPVPVAAPGKRQRSARKKLANIICVKCDRGTTPKSNPIVFCSGCDLTWHQKCHDPEIPDEAILDEDKDWHCYRCTRRQRRSTGIRPLKPQEQSIFAPQRGVSEVAVSSMSADKKRAYFSGLSHAQLVDLLVDISSRVPDIRVPFTSLGQQRSFSPVPASPKPKQEDEDGYRKYPRAGHGFVLPSDPADLDIMKEDPQLKTFSYSLNVSDTFTPKRVWTQVANLGKYFLG